MSTDLGGLEKIKHIVVLMLENRSFDHTLGYLGLPQYPALADFGELGTDINGLRDGDPAFANKYASQTYLPKELDEEAFLRARVDPPHDTVHVATQMSDGMGGFVKALAESLTSKGRTKEAADPDVLKSVMGYMTPEHVPVYDHLARNFCVCDNWFCSIPGPTLPNRFYAVAADTKGVNDDKELIIKEFGAFESFFRYLPSDSWRWYSSDPGILRVIDSQFMFDNSGERFAYFD